MEPVILHDLDNIHYFLLSYSEHVTAPAATAGPETSLRRPGRP